MKIGLIQTDTQGDKNSNLRRIEAAVERLAGDGADLITMPETFAYLGPDAGLRANAEPLDGPSLTRLRNKARERRVYLHCGSILERRGKKIFNTSVVYDRLGEQVAQYSKIHLFDIEAPGGTVFRESEVVSGGDEVVVFTCEGHTVGLSICYDLRFPELYRRQVERGAELLLVPAVFTLMTGKDHWEVLLRARAIENLCYVAAAGNWGTCPPKYTSWGHSMVVDPWGTVLAQAPDCTATLSAELDFSRLAALRAKLPALSHRRRDLFPG
ncbi:MAG: carbon-nitrogen hydrolase family protein [Desulfopila sp.]